METALQYFTTHLQLIIEILVVAICVLSALLVWMSAFRKKDSNEGLLGATVDISGIEDTLKKVLSEVQTSPATTEAATPAVEGPVEVSDGDEGEEALDDSEFEKEAEIRAVLKQKDELIKKLQDKLSEMETAVSEGAAAENTEAMDELQAKVDDLEGKLAEYEIIEDDIADLSTYKEENARLKKLLEEMKSGGSQDFESSISEGVSEPVPVEQAMEIEPTISSEADGDEDLAEDDLVAEFETAVNQQKDAEETEPPVAPEPTVAAAPEPPAPAVAPAPPEQVPMPAAKSVPFETKNVPAEGADDILAEFEPDEKGQTMEASAAESAAASEDVAAASAPDPSSEPPAAASAPVAEASSKEAKVDDSKSEEDAAEMGSIDTDKMLSEMEGLADLVMSGEESSALEEEMDVDKMAAEATKLASGDNN